MSEPRERSAFRHFLANPPSIPTVLVWSVGILILLHGVTAILEQTVQYLPMRDDIGFLPTKKQVADLPHWKAAFYVHVFSSIFSLLAAFTQFLPMRGKRIARVHRWVGRIYVLNTLLLAAPSGFVLAWYAQGGWVGISGFTILAILWFATTLLGYLAIRNRRIDAHQAWMVRSYALTFSAVTLREMQFWFAVYFPPTLNTFPIVAWLSWVPNLLVAELWLAWKRRAARVTDSSPKTREAPRSDRSA